MTITDWCAGSYRRPTATATRRLEGEDVDTGVCFTCGRRLRTLTSGKLRRHRPYLSAAVAAQQHPEAKRQGTGAPSKRPRKR